MILSTFRCLKSRRLVFLSVILIWNATRPWRSAQQQQGVLISRVVTGADEEGALSDGGYTSTPQPTTFEWCFSLNKASRNVLIQHDLLELLVIIPSYTLLLGSQLVATNCPDILCYLPVWTAMFDAIETVTRLADVASYHYISIDPSAPLWWTPNAFHLVIASAATQFKVAGFAYL